MKSFLWIVFALAAITLGCCIHKPELLPEPPARKLSVEDDAAIADRCADGCVIVPKEIFEQMIKRLKERGA